MMRHQNSGIMSCVLDMDRGSEMSVVSMFPIGFLTTISNKTVRVSPWIVPQEQAPTIKSDWCVKGHGSSWPEGTI